MEKFIRNKFLELIRKMVPSQTVVFFLGLILLMLTMTTLRIAFLLVNWETFSDTSLPQLAFSFFNGARFDLHIVLVLIGVFFLAAHIPGRWKMVFPFFQKILWLPLGLFLPAVALTLLNIHYYNEAGRHLSYEIFSVGYDKYDLSASLRMIMAYRGTILILLFYCIVLILCWSKILDKMSKGESKRGLLIESAWMLLYLVFLVYGLKGTLLGKPLRMSHAFIQGSTELGHLSLNPVFTISRSLEKGDTVIPVFYPEERALNTVRELLGTSRTISLGDDAPLYRKNRIFKGEAGRQYNVVILVMESWSAKYIGAYGNGLALTPEFDKLASDGFLFENFYAVGNRTIEGLAALCLGIPSFNHSNDWTKGSFLSGSLEQNRFLGLGNILSGHGYNSVYIHGEDSRTFRHASVARLAGFRRHLGREELKLRPQDTDGVWGGWDHVLLDKLFETLRSEREPFLAVWVSLTNHPPYSLPDDTFRTASRSNPERKFMDSIRYTDHYIGRFFDKVKSEDFFNNTIFIIAAR
jgi:phosphoglycerol transferase MdoB-like AlkP superfamily enzyme